MKKYLLPCLLTALFFGITQVDLSGQEREAKKYDNPQWKQVYLIDYKPGHMNKARDIIDNYHQKATEMAGTPGPEMVMELHSGDYDLMVIWGMEGGITDMNWEMSPNGIKWRAAMVELAGGDDEAREIMKSYQDCIARTTSYLARVDN